MMPFAPPIFTTSWGEHVVIRSLRRWAACRELHQPALAPLVQLAGELGASPHAGVALASLFQLAEGMLGRPLVAACCCDPEPSRDERAVLLMLAHAPDAGPIHTSRAIPHGLAGPLAWAALSTRMALRMDGAGERPPTVCPFTA